MHRRAFIVAVGLASLVSPRPVRAQQASGAARVGFLSNSNPADRALVEAFRRGMAELGWVEGRNFVIDFRWAESDLSRHPRLVGDLISAKADVIVVAGPSASRAALQATRTVPIVAAVLGDPDIQGIVTSLARPGGNITGLAWQAK